MKLTFLLIVAASLNASAGIASWYGWDHAGRTMANGRPFNPMAMTCASWHHPFGTKLRVTNIATGKSVVVIVTDRGPAKRLRRQVDLSLAAFSAIANPKRGLAKVRCTPI